MGKEIAGKRERVRSRGTGEKGGRRGGNKREGGGGEEGKGGYIQKQLIAGEQQLHSPL